MTFLSPARVLVLTGCLAGSLAVAGPANAASVAVADVGGGYSGKVLEKVITVWAPPKSLKGEHSLAVRATIDENGKLQNCTTTRKSGLDALDVSACAAVRKAAPFGTPPYALPIDVHLAFWTGLPKAAPATQAPPAQAAAVPEAKESKAASSAELARQRAEAIAREAENTQPQPVGAAPVPAATGTGLTAEEMQLDMGAKPGTAKAQDKYGEQYRKYFSRISWALRNAIFIPAETAAGTYYATVRLKVDAAGAIKEHSLVESSGDKLLDKYVLQGVRRAGKVEAPPSGLPREMDVTLTLVR